MTNASQDKPEFAEDSSSEQWKAHLDELLNEALMHTFPCSDPIALSIDPPTDAEPVLGEAEHQPPSPIVEAGS